jgi:hypothetical protein
MDFKSMYVSYAKDILIALIAAQPKENVFNLLDVAIGLVLKADMELSK